MRTLLIVSVFLSAPWLTVGAGASVAGAAVVGASVAGASVAAAVVVSDELSSLPHPAASNPSTTSGAASSRDRCEVRFMAAQRSQILTS